MATLGLNAIETQRKARVDRAYDRTGVAERHLATDSTLVLWCRYLHYCVRTGAREDAFGHAKAIATHLFEKGGVPLVACPTEELDDPLICHAAELLRAVERMSEDYEPGLSHATMRVLTVMHGLFRVEVQAHATLKHGMTALLRNVGDLGD